MGHEGVSKNAGRARHSGMYSEEHAIVVCIVVCIVGCIVGCIVEEHFKNASQLSRVKGRLDASSLALVGCSGTSSGLLCNRLQVSFMLRGGSEVSGLDMPTS